MEEHLNVLIAEQDDSLARSVADMLSSEGHACTVEGTLEAALEQARTGGYDVVIVDLGMGEGGGMELMDAALQSNPDCQVIILTGKSGAAEAVEAMSRGASTYLQKPLNPIELRAVVDRAAERVSLQRDRLLLRQELNQRYGFENIIGNSKPMMDVFAKIRQISPTDATVLICGETGTGKELVARAIHYNSLRKNNRFVPVNCAGIVETILESELFGHERGAFTGATSSRVGLFEYANHGTLFLDEVGDMAASSQSKLLRVLEQGEVIRVGSNEPIKVDVRVLTATNQDLWQKTKDGSFRADLFYRLNVITINLPPLRERQGDIILLIDFFMRQLSEVYNKKVYGISPEARKILLRYHWPGNIRQLKNCLEHMMIVTTDEILGEDDLPEYIRQESGVLLEEPTLSSMAGVPLEEVEKHHIRRTLELVHGNREKAASLLGIGERTLYRKIEKYGLS